jgi:hypothetical protein
MIYIKQSLFKQTYLCRIIQLRFFSGFCTELEGQLLNESNRDLTEQNLGYTGGSQRFVVCCFSHWSGILNLAAEKINSKMYHHFEHTYT